MAVLQNPKDAEYLFIDFDGTLFDTSKGVFKSMQVVSDYYGHGVLENSVLRTMIGPPLKESFTRVFGLKPEQIDEAIKVYRSYYTDHGLYECHTYPGVEDLLKSFKEAGKKVYLATSKPLEYAKILLKEHGLFDYFDFIGGADIEEKRGTKIDVLRWVIDENNLHNVLDKCLMIGDTKYDTEGAKQAGIATMGILWGFGTREGLLECGTEFIAETAQDVKKAILG